MNIERRDFLKGAVLGGAALGGLALVGCSSKPAGGSNASSAAAPASTRYSWEAAPAPIAADKITETIDADVLVIGAGTAGMVATQSAAEAGAKVVLIEKNDKFSARGHDIGCINSSVHKEAGVEINKAEVEEYLMELNNNAINRDLIKTWMDHSGEVVDYYREKLAAEGIPAQLGMLNVALATTENPLLKQYYTTVQFGTSMFTEEGEWTNHRTVRFMEKWALEAGADIRYSTKAEQLVQDDTGKVTGAIASTADDKYIKINAANGVILATGDIGGNEEMLDAWCPFAKRAPFNLYDPSGMNTGDGVKLGLWAGAAMQRGTAAPMLLPQPMMGGPLPSIGDLSWLGVNLNGQRYMNEYSSIPGICAGAMLQPKSTCYSIYDGSFKEDVLAIYPNNVSSTEALMIPDNIDEVIEKAIKDGKLFKADTLEDLAKAFGAPSDVFVKTVARYNELVASGVDSDYSKPSMWLSAIDTAPYYASLIPVTVMVVLYGLNVDSQSRVCSDDDQPIEGLYAIGNIQGNMFTNMYPMLTPGLSHGRCYTFGRLIGQKLAKIK